MLQEIFLSLSGVPSPIWEKLRNDKNNGESLRDHVSPPEQAMLANLSRISTLHIEVKEHAIAISSRHRSLVCRAVSSSISHTYLAAFRQRIIEVESSILKGDASHVGDYHIVPLSTLVADFAPWTRRLEWLRKATRLMKGTKTTKDVLTCSSATILDFLEIERHTGYTDIANFAMQLLVVAQRTWMKPILAWILYGQLPSFGSEDFLVQEGPSKDAHGQCLIDSELTPKFVTSEAAEHILAIGNAIRQLRTANAAKQSGDSQSTTMSLLVPHLSELKLLQYPLISSLLESTMLTLDQSVSRHALSSMLPRSKIIEICLVFQDYMLLGRGEFAIALIENSEARIDGRQKTQSSVRPVRKLGKPEDLTLKDVELNSILSKTWSDLASLQGQSDREDDILETAKQYLKLKIVHEADSTQKGMLLSTILPTSTVLQVELPPNSPLKIFLDKSSIHKYSRFSAYLLSIRRSQLRVSYLWKFTSHRRCHPTPLGPPTSATDFGRRACQSRRNRETLRTLQMRKFWATMNKSLYFLNEFSSYLHEDVIRKSWKHFETWLDMRDHQNHGAPEDLDASSSICASTMNTSFNSAQQFRNSHSPGVSKDDPRSLARAHSTYLTALQAALLVENEQFVRALRSVLDFLDHFVGLFNRLSKVWQGLDLQEDDGVLDAFTDFAQDEKAILSEMTSSRNELEYKLEQLVILIKDIEKAQDVGNLSGALTGVTIAQDPLGQFIPWRARTLDRLIMKLDVLYGKNEATDELTAEFDYD